MNGVVIRITSWPGQALGCPIKHRVDDWCFLHVMAGLGPAVHDVTDRAKDVDGRHKGGHDEMRQAASIALSIRPVLNRTEVGQAGQ